MEQSVRKFIMAELKALKELKNKHPRDEKLIDSLIEDYEEKLKEGQKNRNHL